MAPPPAVTRCILQSRSRAADNPERFRKTWGNAGVRDISSLGFVLFQFQ